MKLTMLTGLPASGKSTLARQQVKDSGNDGRINRDDLRAMLFESVWTGKREGVVVDCEKAIAEVLLRHGMNPIVDDTNLSHRHRDMWANFAKGHAAKFEVVGLNPNMEELISRDRFRDKRVGKAVIHRMALMADLILWDGKKIVLCDIDGTLSNGEHREHFVRQEKKDWTNYYALLHNDKPIEIVVRWVQELAKDHTVCLVSGRPDTYQESTMNWLSEHNIPYEWLFMRAGGDKRPDVMVKADFLAHIPKEKIAFAIDDRPCVIREVWRANGVRVFPVRGDCEEF